MFCAISGKPPLKPVVSPSSKCVFEKELIEQYIELNNKDPITNDPLQSSDLIEIASTPQQYSLALSINSSTAVANYSIPGLLSTLRNEWDAVMLENFELRKQLDVCKKSLSDSLYKYDAVAKIAAEASMERDHLRRELSNLVGSISVTDKIGTVSDENGPQAKRIKLDFRLRNEFSDRLKEASIQYIAEFKKNKKKMIHFTEVSEVSSKSIEECKVCIRNDHIDLGKRSAVLIGSGRADIIGPREASVSLPDGIDYLAEYEDVLYGIKENSFIEIDVKSQNIVKTFPFDRNEENIVFIGHAKHLLPSYFILVTETGRILGINTELNASFLTSDFKLKHPVKFVSYHKDGALVAMSNMENDISIINLLEPDNSPTTFKFSFPVLQVKFALNGYWMFVQGENQIEVIDLRKAVEAPAVEVIKSDHQITTFEIDDTGKGLLLCFEGKNISWFEYVKGQGFKESLNFNTNDETIKTILLTFIEKRYILKAISNDKVTTYVLQ